MIQSPPGADLLFIISIISVFPNNVKYITETLIYKVVFGYSEVEAARLRTERTGGFMTKKGGAAKPRAKAYAHPRINYSSSAAAASSPVISET